MLYKHQAYLYLVYKPNPNETFFDVLQNLRTLKIAGNDISDPNNLFQIFGLQELDLSNNKIARLTDEMITQKLELAKLDLSSNWIDSIQG